MCVCSLSFSFLLYVISHQKNFCCKSNSVQRLKAAPTECWGRGLSPTRPALEDELVVLRLLDPVTMSPDSASQPWSPAEPYPRRSAQLTSRWCYRKQGLCGGEVTPIPLVARWPLSRLNAGLTNLQGNRQYPCLPVTTSSWSPSHEKSALVLHDPENMLKHNVCFIIYEDSVGLSRPGRERHWSFHLQSRFHNSGTVTILDQLTLHYGGCSAHCKVFSSIPGLYPLDGSSMSCSAVKIRSVSRHCWTGPNWRPLTWTQLASSGDNGPPDIARAWGQEHVRRSWDPQLAADSILPSPGGSHLERDQATRRQGELAKNWWLTPREPEPSRWTTPKFLTQKPREITDNDWVVKATGFGGNLPGWFVPQLFLRSANWLRVEQACTSFFFPWLFATLWTAACQASLSITNSRSFLRLMFIESVMPFNHLFPASGSFPMSQLFTSGGQNIGASASTSVLPMNTQDWSPLGWTGWISLQSKGLSRVFSNTTVQKHQFSLCSAFFMVQLSHPYVTTGKTIVLSMTSSAK